MRPIRINDAVKYRQFKAYREQLEFHRIPSMLAHDVAWVLIFDEVPKHHHSEADQAMVRAAYDLLFRGHRGGVA
ncbi:MAG: hypothetical protein AAF215_27885 [Cyanobacteria bacterium P01_A01_bin.123]